MKLINKLFKIIFSKLTFAILLLILQVIVLYVLFMLFYEYIVYLFGGFTFLSILLVLYIVNSNENSSYKIAWIIPILIFPVVGIAFYCFCHLQISIYKVKKALVKEQSISKKYLTSNKEISSNLEKEDKSTYNLINYINNTSNNSVYNPSDIKYFKCGEDMFSSLINDLKNAKKYIFLEYFILEKSYMWDTILEILKEKVKENVEVRVMYDGMCSLMMLPYNYKDELLKYNIKCKMFFPIKLELSLHQNNRDHRKICVIDGDIAYTGGINIADEYINKKKRFGYWKDTAIRINGDCVNSYTVMFIEMWNIDGIDKCQYSKYINNSHVINNNGYIISYGDNPLNNKQIGKRVYMDIINTAKDYIDIITPYLILDEELLNSLIYASNRGVKVRIIMPHIPDKKLVYYLGRSYYKDLISNGISIYEYKKGFTHAKMFISDDIKAVVGTINLDYRSLYLHFECASYIYKNNVISSIKKDYDNTILESIKIDKNDVDKYNIFKRIIGKILRLISPLM